MFLAVFFITYYMPGSNARLSVKSKHEQPVQYIYKQLLVQGRSRAKQSGLGIDDATRGIGSQEYYSSSVSPIPIDRCFASYATYPWR